MNRYFLYLILINMIINVIIFVPKILIEYRYEGAVMGMLIAIPIGFTLACLYSKAITKFPGQGLPEIADKFFKHRWLTILHFGSIQLTAFSAGLITLVGFIDILTRFINPEMPRLLLLTIYLIAILFIIQLPTERVMYILEIILFMNTPLIGFIVFKAFTSDYLSWDSILEVGTHLFDRPSLKAIAAASYVFSGYANLVIFNRVIKEKLKVWNFIIIFFMSLFNLFTTFFIPIGFHGSDGAQEYLYPWISTSDSLRLVYSPIERVIFIFLMFYMSITLMSITMHWHVAFELFKGTFRKKENKKLKWIILSAYCGCAVIAVMFIETILLNQITVYWMIARLGLEVVIVISFSLWARRRLA
ncbi:GerAB/ArcD/ProY family transporter [Neobacillus sp. GCM10023253]|uniref:GerAB/ArcD/ProY family transporter n=1 Tax=Neobacillus sp. GCM10023253 TaxID=3252644 RepID=UPI00361ED0A1